MWNNNRRTVSHHHMFCLRGSYICSGETTLHRYRERDVNLYFRLDPGNALLHLPAKQNDHAVYKCFRYASYSSLQRAATQTRNSLYAEIHTHTRQWRPLPANDDSRRRYDVNTLVTYNTKTDNNNWISTNKRILLTLFIIINKWAGSERWRCSLCFLCNASSDFCRDHMFFMRFLTFRVCVCFISRSSNCVRAYSAI